MVDYNNALRLIGQAGVAEAKKVVEAFNKAAGHSFTAAQLLNWEGFDGDGVVSSRDYNIFDRAVRAFLGAGLYDEAEVTARMIQVFYYKLGFGPARAGGIDIKAMVKAHA